jgi:short subunit dehydrogenase-like uncharacterized protein
VRRVEAFLAVGDSPLIRAGARLAGLAAPVLPALLASPLGRLLGAQAEALRPPSDAVRRAARFSVVAEASRHFRRARVAVSGLDPYGTTAVIVARCAAALADSDGTVRSGVLTPAEAFPADRFLADIAAAAGLRVDVD